MSNRSDNAPDDAPRHAPGRRPVRRSRAFSRSSLLWTLYVPSFLLQVGVGMLIPVLPKFIEEMGVGVGLVGLGISGVLIGTMVFDVPSGLLVGRFGHKRTMLAGTGLLAVFAVLTAFSGSFPSLLVLRFFSGVAMALWSISRMAYVSDTVPTAMRGRTLASFGGVQRIGALIGPVLGGVIGAQISLEAVFIAQAILSAATLLMLITFVKEEDGDPQNLQRRVRRAPLLRTLVDNGPQLARGGTGMVSIQLVRRGRELLLPLWGASLGLEVDQIGLVIGVAAAVDMAMFLPVGYVMDRWGRKWMSVPSLIVMAAGMALLPLTTDIWTFAAVGVITGFGNGLSTGAMMTLGADLAPRARAGEFIGVWRLIGDVGGASGPIVVGQVANALTLGTSSVLIAGFSLFGAAGMYFLVPETLRPEEKRIGPAPPIDSSAAAHAETAPAGDDSGD